MNETNQSQASVYISNPTPLANTREIDAVLFAVGRGIDSLRTDISNSKGHAELLERYMQQRDANGERNLARLDSISGQIAEWIAELNDSRAKTLSATKVRERLEEIYETGMTQQ